MKKLIKSMNFTAFSSEKFENPSLQKHFAVLEALALDRDMPDDVPDHTSALGALVLETRAGTARTHTDTHTHTQRAG